MVVVVDRAAGDSGVDRVGGGRFDRDRDRSGRESGVGLGYVCGWWHVVGHGQRAGVGGGVPGDVVCRRGHYRAGGDGGSLERQEVLYQMITLISGVPGSGKTLYAVWSLQRELKAGRRLVVNGVKGLVLDHVMVDDEWVCDWQNRCELGDIIVVDEVQRIWPQVSVGVKPTPAIEALHVHRHKGVDFIVITQHPNRMNAVIRDLVGRHVHVRRMFGLSRAMVYEWDSVHNPKSGFRDAVKTLWKYPKDVYELYVSAEMHTKPKAVIPKALFILPVALLVGGLLAWRGYGQVSSGFGSVGGGKPKGSSASSGAVGSGGSVKSAGGAIDAVSSRWRVAGEYVVDGRGYVLLVDASGRFRSELVGGFRGDTVRIEGTVDGERVASWSGGGAIDAGVRK